jgi:hypothetical protein
MFSKSKTCTRKAVRRTRLPLERKTLQFLASDAVLSPRSLFPRRLARREKQTPPFEYKMTLFVLKKRHFDQRAPHREQQKPLHQRSMTLLGERMRHCIE